ncbi:MAG: sulfatase [Dehalococcoidia bacterium]|nr:sulfatase [Dehalococcoidia bacterium]
MKYTTKADAPNILLITIDALRRDHLGCYGYNRNTSPNIDALASRGVQFMEAISNGGFTASSFPAIMASALPPIEKFGGKTILENNITIAEIFKEAGYHTAAFHCNPLLSHFYGYQKGFDAFDDSFQRLNRWRVRMWIRRKAHLLGRSMARIVHIASLIMQPLLSRALPRPIVSAEEITDKSLQWLGSNSGNFFLWLHYMDVHEPYLPTKKYLRRFSDKPVKQKLMTSLGEKRQKSPGKLSADDIKTIIDLYDADINYADEQIGVLLERMGKRLENTIVIITADHGDEFGEHGVFGHKTVYDNLLRVPLIVTGPGINMGIMVKGQAGLIDLSPTILEMVGIKKPGTFLGKSLWPSICSGQAIGEEGVISTVVNDRLRQRRISYRIPGWKYICTESLNDGCLLGEEVYDLRGDPGETNNLYGVNNDEADKFELEARKKIAQFKHLKAEGKTDYEKAAVKAKMKSLKKSGRI